MINQDIAAELSFLLHSLVLGMFIMILYDVLRIFRKLVKHSVWVTAFEDLLYWLICGVCIFLMLYQENSGDLRWFVVAGISIGMLLYNGTISTLLNDRIAKAIQFIFRILGKIIAVILWPIRKFLGIVKKATKIVEKRGQKLYIFEKKQLKKLMKRVRIIISKR